MLNDANKNCDDVELMDEGITIIAYDKNDKKVFVQYSELTWRNPYEDGDDYDLPLFLTLAEIREQLCNLGYKPTFYVCSEQGFSGTIYKYDKYPDFNYWVEYGNTNGYA